jgi:hypothetical protein
MNAENLKDLLTVCHNKHVCTGETLLVINRMWGFTFETLPDSRLEDTKTWMLNNWFRVYAVLEPERHEKIMTEDIPHAQAYRDFYNSAGQRGRSMMSGRVNIPWYNKD